MFHSRLGPMNSLLVDQMLLMYDLRTLRALPPMRVSLDPLFVRFVHDTNRIAAVAQVRTRNDPLIDVHGQYLLIT